MIFGIDVGGSFIKGGIVHSPKNIKLKMSLMTPQPSTPTNIFTLIKPWITNEISKVGFAIPCVVKNNKALTTTNIDDSWQNIILTDIANEIIKTDCTFINDADAAAVAEILYYNQLSGLTIVLTFGTGIGFAMVYNGILIPNLECGRITLPNQKINAETYVSGKAKLNLSWDQYIERMNEFLFHICDMFQPDNIIIGGGISEQWENWGHKIQTPCNIYKANFGNSAGIIGAALYANGFGK